jgi:hypothetical protein
LPAFLTGTSAHGFYFGIVRDIIESREIKNKRTLATSKEGIDEFS